MHLPRLWRCCALRDGGLIAVKLLFYDKQRKGAVKSEVKERAEVTQKVKKRRGHLGKNKRDLEKWTELSVLRGLKRNVTESLRVSQKSVGSRRGVKKSEK